MRELKLRYFLDLVSNVGARAQADAKLLARAQESMGAAISGTNRKLADYDKIILRAGKNTGLVNQAIVLASGSAVAFDRALGRMGGNTALERQARYAMSLAARYTDLRKQVEGATAAMVTAGKTAGSVAAGGAAGVYALDRVVKAPMDYSLRLAHMANTAYSGKDEDTRVAGKRTLNAAITAAIRVGGGSRDDAAEALGDLIASGKVPIGDAITALPSIMHSSTGSASTAKGLSSVAISAMQSGVKADQLGEFFNMATVAGQAGRFELRDMEKWLPSAMAAGRGIGLTGMEGSRRLLASMQASMTTAGTKDEAGNNVVNLLGKINSEDTAKDFAKQGIDLRSELMKGVAGGGNALDTFIGLVDRVTASVQKDPKFKTLAAQALKEGNTGQDTDTTVALRELFQGTAVSKVVQDRQALMALLAEMSNRGYVRDVMDQTRKNRNELSTSFAVINEEVATTRQRGVNEALIGAQEAFDKAAPALNAVAGKATDLAQRFPNLTIGLVAATGALTVFTAALGASGLLGLLTNLKSGGVPGSGKPGGKPGAGSKVAGAARGLLGRLGLYGALAYELFETRDAVSELYKVKNRDGVALTPEAKAQTTGSVLTLAGMDADFGRRRSFIDYSQPTLPTADFLSLTAPSSLAKPMPMGQQPAEVKVGEGRLQVDLRITDDRVMATTSVVQQPSLVRINPGNTNPAGYARGTRGGQ